MQTLPITNEEQEVVRADLIAGIWRRHSNGDTRLVSEMPDEYLQATIKMIKRGYDSHGMKVDQDRDLYLPILESEVVKRGLIPAEDGWDN